MIKLSQDFINLFRTEETAEQVLENFMNECLLFHGNVYTPLDRSIAKPVEEIALPIEISEKIHPYKRKAIEILLENVPDTVDEIWLFGSSLNHRCTEDSDIDICIIGKYTAKDETSPENYWLRDPRIQPVDVLIFTQQQRDEQQNLRIFKEINNKGLLIYKRC